MNNMMNKKGVTLVELIVAIAVGLIIMAAIYSLMNTGQQSSASLARKVLTQQDARAVLDLMAMEIRMASFNPTDNASLGGTTPACNSMNSFAGGVASRGGLQIAEQNRMLIAMDLDASGSIGDAPNEYIYYEYSNNRITRNVSCGTGNQVILGGTASGTRVINDANTPLFQYFADSATPMTLPLTNAQIQNIRRIRINIVAEIESQGKAFHVSEKTYTTDVLVRNHAISRKSMP
jgi:type IV pilus assembly protein PilW